MADANTANARRLPFASRCRHTGLLHAQNKLILNNTQGICTTKARSAFAACGERAPCPLRTRREKARHAPGKKCPDASYCFERRFATSRATNTNAPSSNSPKAA